MLERPFDLRRAEPCIGPSVVPLYELASVEMVGISEADAAAINLITNKGNEMGEAKMRGDFAKRQQEAIAAEKERQARREENRHKPMQKKLSALAVMAAIAASTGYR